MSQCIEAKNELDSLPREIEVRHTIVPTSALSQLLCRLKCRWRRNAFLGYCSELRAHESVRIFSETFYVIVLGLTLILARV